ncbi:MAG: NAD(P)/FAD-dependent oxidoreductase [Nitrospirota bacterium]|nr:NAD(P)/FAD-dependent oxidoreductase [Nitrospirota bacterium]
MISTASLSQPIDIAIIGAGAAGMAAGIFAAQTRPDLSIVLLDGARTIGAKILVSGGGRCNVTNVRVTSSDFNGTHRFVERVLQRFDEQATAQWFDSLGVPLKEEPAGKLFPVTNTARTVLQALLDQITTLGVRLLPQHRVKGLTPHEQHFSIETEGETFIARRIILATGGQSLPKTGSDGYGWMIARQLGHTVTPTYPALVPLLIHDPFFHQTLSGISHEVTLMTRVDDKLVDRRTGSLLWTHFGISGPVTLDASRFWIIAHGQGHEVTLFLNFFPGQSFEDIDRWLSNAGVTSGRQTVAGLLSERLPVRVAKTMCAYINDAFPPTPQEARPQEKTKDLGTTPLGELRRSTRRTLTQALTNLSLPVIGSRGWNFAEVTAGGIPLKEVNPYSMASRKLPGLYLIGEMLDCDGRIGGFNFQWAWSTGYIAGTHAAESLT